MELYDKLRPLLEEYTALTEASGGVEPWWALLGPLWDRRQRELKMRRKAIQMEILQLTQQDRTLVN